MLHCPIFSMTWESLKRLAVVAQKTAKVSLNAARTAVNETYKQNKIRAEAQEAREVSAKILFRSKTIFSERRSCAEQKLFGKNGAFSRNVNFRGDRSPWN